MCRPVCFNMRLCIGVYVCLRVWLVACWLVQLVDRVFFLFICVCACMFDWLMFVYILIGVRLFFSDCMFVCLFVYVFVCAVCA